MLNALKLIWKRIPKKIVATIIIIPASYAANRFFDYLFYDKPFLAFSKIYEPLIWITAGLLIYFIFFTVLSSLRIISKLLKKEPNKPIAEIDKTNKTSKKKEMPSRFELERLNYIAMESTVFINRKWWPDSNPPGIEDFLSELDFSDIYCGQCKSEFLVIRAPVDLYECPNSNCINKKTFIEEEVFNISKRAQAEFKGKLRRNFEKYWEKYKKLYLDFTKNKPEEFEEPLR